MKNSKYFFLTLVCLLSLSASAKKKVQPQPLKPMHEFVDELMSRMTLEEKIGQLNLQVAGDITTGSAQDTQVSGLIAAGQMGGVFNLKGVDKIRALQEVAVKQSRLSIPLIIGMDVIHGYETIFPIPLAMSCSWDMEAIERMAQISAKEATADGINWVYSPMVDISVDPRWGRVAEGGGEDPYLGSAIARAYIRGYQGEPLQDDRAIYNVDRALACVKHFALYGAIEAGRDYNTVDMSHWRMYNQYFPPYKAAAEAGAASFMSSFNLVDGLHATANRWLLTDVLRHQWQWEGFVATDYGSIGEMTNHGFGDLQTNSAQALKAGTDMDMCSQGFLFTLKKSVEEGLVSEEEINTACRRILEAKYKLGLFADPYRYCDPKRRPQDIYTADNRAASRTLAAETFVLLKNQDNLLPLKKEGRIALIGPMADDRKNVAGTWCVAYTPERYATVREAMERALKGSGAEVLYAQGCNLTHDDALQTAAEFGKTINRVDPAQAKAEALAAARQADVIVCAMGECADMSGESSSRASLEMPDAQRELLSALAELGKPIVLLHFSGRPTVLTWEQEHLQAIMNVWFGGSEAGDAICDVLFGDQTPSGKLTMTFPQAIGQVPIYYNHLNTGRPVREGADRYQKYASNYLDVRNDPLYPFGYGLSYTTFAYSAPEVEPMGTLESVSANGNQTSPSLREGDRGWVSGPLFRVRVRVENTGNRAGDEVVQLYIRDMVSSLARPVKELKGFRRIHLAAGEAQTVDFTLSTDDLGYYDGEGNLRVEPGEFQIMTGPNSRDVQTVTVELNAHSAGLK